MWTSTVVFKAIRCRGRACDTSDGRRLVRILSVSGWKTLINSHFDSVAVVGMLSTFDCR